MTSLRYSLIKPKQNNYKMHEHYSVINLPLGKKLK